MKVEFEHLFTIYDPSSMVEKLKERGIMRDYINYFGIEYNTPIIDTISDNWESVLEFIADRTEGAIIYVDTDEGAEFYKIDKNSFFDSVLMCENRDKEEFVRYALQIELTDKHLVNTLNTELHSTLNRFDVKRSYIKDWLIRRLF